MDQDGGSCLSADCDRFRLLVEQAAIGIEQVSLDATVLEANDALCAILGYPPEGLRGKSLAELIHPEYLAVSLKKHQQLIGGTLSYYSLETRYLRKDGSPVWVKVTSSLARDSGSPAFRISIVDDISGRVQARERREGDEAKYRAIIDTAVDSIVVIDDRGRIQAFNRAAERTFGYRSSEMIGQNVRILMPEPDRGAHDGYITNYLQTSQAKIIGIGREVTGQRRDGSRWNSPSPNGVPVASGISPAPSVM
jgi:two-component system, LuxR family, sensor kinase FixL